jgi:3-oxoacyl-[acyl-carrier protein] reductase
LISLTYDSAVQYAPYVRVNCIAPGWVNTEMNQELPEDFVKDETEKILVKRFGEPEEIAKVVTFLASEEASFINSAVIKVDGGWY